MGWKTDWLYVCIFQVVKDIWATAQREAEKVPALMGNAPEHLLILECEGVRWEYPFCQPPIMRAWVYDGVEIQERFSAGELYPQHNIVHGAFYTQGSFQFHISADRKRIAITYVLGPRYGRGYILKPQGQGKRGRLVPAGGTGWIS